VPWFLADGASLLVWAGGLVVTRVVAQCTPPVGGIFGSDSLCKPRLLRKEHVKKGKSKIPIKRLFLTTNLKLFEVGI
jgi:hypothetical protein